MYDCRIKSIRKKCVVEHIGTLDGYIVGVNLSRGLCGIAKFESKVFADEQDATKLKSQKYKCQLLVFKIHNVKKTCLLKSNSS